MSRYGYLEVFQSLLDLEITRVDCFFCGGGCGVGRGWLLYLKIYSSAYFSTSQMTGFHVKLTDLIAKISITVPVLILLHTPLI